LINIEEIKQYRKKSSYLKYNKNLFDGAKTAIKKLWCVVFVCILFIIAEVAGGLIASSLAILSDAVHLGSDLFGFAIKKMQLLDTLMVTIELKSRVLRDLEC